MLCRLCLIDDSNYQKLEGAICDMLKAVLRKKYIQISEPVICNRCVKKVENAFDFKSTSLRTQKILSLYGGFNTKIVYVRDNKLCVTSKNDDSIKLCKTCLRLIEHNFCINLLGRYDIIDLLKVYVPEVVLNDKETSLICYKCSDSLRTFSEIVRMNSDLENMIMRCLKEKTITDVEQLTVEYLIGLKNEQDSIENCNIIKLLDGNDLFLQNDFANPSINEESEKRIIKKIIEEDVDLFYKEKPDFDIDDVVAEENETNSDQQNTFFGVYTRQLLCNVDEDHHSLRNSIEEESSLRLSFETEDSSLSPGAMSDTHFYECEEGNEDGKKDREEEESEENPFIFFEHYVRNENCGCENGTSEMRPKTTKKKCDAEKCKWKKEVWEYGCADDNENGDGSVKKAKKDGKKKCRKAYGIEFKELWCTQCRWKKACTRFGNAKAVSRR